MYLKASDYEYELDYSHLEQECAILIDKKNKRIWIRGTEIKYTYKNMLYLEQITTLLENKDIFSAQDVEDMNVELNKDKKRKTSTEAVQRWIERINHELKLDKKSKIFISMQNYEYRINSKNYHKNFLII